MSHTKFVAVVFLLASEVVRANQCSRDGECPSDGESQNGVWLLQTKLQTDVIEDVKKLARVEMEEPDAMEGSMVQTEQDQREPWIQFANYYDHALRFLATEIKARPAPAPAGDPAAVDQNTQKAFEHIFKDNVWGSHESHSGTGSTVSNTAKYRACIGSWIKKYNVSVFLDIPCGDGNWQKDIPGIDKVSYYGYDISSSAVDLAKTKNHDMANMHYGVLDMVSSDPPLKADMIMVKEVIQHLPLEMGLKMLQHAKHAGIKWLVVTHCPTCVNKEIEVGDWYPGPDALAPPFNFVNVLEKCDGDNAGESDKLALFDLKAWSGE